jgi:hypothetical protein
MGEKMKAQGNICSYCINIPGVGPSPPSVPENLFNRPIGEGANVVIVPALGMLVPGSFLAISKEHIFSFAHFSRMELESLEAYMRLLTSSLEPLFGEYLIFEHGASELETHVPHGGCITHAHFHLFPVADKAGDWIRKLLPFESLPNLASIANNTHHTYALLGIKNNYYISKSPSLPSQWIRRVIVDCLGISNHWDWGVEFGLDELNITLFRLKERRFDF